MKSRFFKQKSTGKWLKRIDTGEAMGNVKDASLGAEGAFSLLGDVTVVEVEIEDSDKLDTLRVANQWKSGKDGLPVVSTDLPDALIAPPSNPPGERQLRRERIIAGRGTPEGDAVYNLAMLTGALGLIEED